MRRVQIPCSVRRVPRAPRRAIVRLISSSVKAYPHILTADLSNNAITAHFAVPSKMKEHWDAPKIVAKGGLSTRELMPEWMQFLHGELAVTDHKARINFAFRNQLTRGFLDVLKKEKELGPNKYLEFWQLYKENVYNGISTGEIELNNPVLTDLLIFKDNEGKYYSLAEWKEKHGVNPVFDDDREKHIWTSALTTLEAALKERVKQHKENISSSTTTTSTSSSSSSSSGVDATTTKADPLEASSSSSDPSLSDLRLPERADFQSIAKMLLEALKLIAFIGSRGILDWIFGWRARMRNFAIELLCWVIVALAIVAWIGYTLERDRKAREAEELRKKQEEEAKKKAEEELWKKEGYVGYLMRVTGLK